MEKSSSVEFGAAFASLGKLQSSAPAKLEPGLQSWSDLLSDALQNEILPRLLAQQRSQGTMYESPSDFSGLPSEAVLEAFVDLIIADDMDQARAIADRLIVQTGSRETLLESLLAPAARLLGLMWEKDIADFVTVTLGLYRLDQIMKETAGAGQTERMANAHEYRILLLPVPGEQHGFGLGMIADAFREDGWCVRSGPAVPRAKLLNLVRDEWFDVIGFSVSSDRWLKGLPSCFRAVRAASCNNRTFLMAGGQAIANQVERTRFLGIDATAGGAQDALLQANNFMTSTVTPGLRQSNNRLIEFG